MNHRSLWGPMPEFPSSEYEYQVGGSLPLNAPTYVTRQADFDLIQGLRAGEFCYVLNPRQTGKSSLRMRTMQKLQAEGFACAGIDLTAISSQDITANQWYAGLVYSLADSFSLLDRFDICRWWSQQELLSPVQKFSLFIEDILLQEVYQDIVIFIDEIDSVLSLNFSVDEFFSLLESYYQKRTTSPKYQRLTFAILGVALPGDLTLDKKQTLFKKGRAIHLSGFQLSECEPLVAGLTQQVDRGKDAIAAILTWTGGQPFLTQKVCELFYQNMAQVSEVRASITQHRMIEWVDNLVQTQIIDNWEVKDEPEHLKTIRDRILRSKQRVFDLLELYQQILLNMESRTRGNSSSETIPSLSLNESADRLELRLSGLAVKQGDTWRVANRIYQSVFNQNWVDKQLAALQPSPLPLSF